MEALVVHFTKRSFNLASWLIRWVTLSSRLSLATDSHCPVQNGPDLIGIFLLIKS